MPMQTAGDESFEQDDMNVKTVYTQEGGCGCSSTAEKVPVEEIHNQKCCLGSECVSARRLLWMRMHNQEGCCGQKCTAKQVAVDEDV